MAATHRPRPGGKAERDRLRADWAGQGLGVDEIARRFRRRYQVSGLRAYRWANGFTLEQVANAYNERLDLHDRRRAKLQVVSLWEQWPDGHGAVQPSLRVLAHLAAVYGTSTGRLVAAIHNEDDPADSNVPAAPTNAASGTQSPANVGARKALWFSRPATARGSPRPTTIAGLEQVTRGFREMYHASAGADILPGVADHAKLACGWLRGSSKTKDRQRIGVTAGEVVLLAGRILFFDRGDHASALPYYEEALGITEAVGDGALQACVLAHMSRLPATNGRVREALDFLDGAQRLAAQHGSALLRAWIAAVEAKTHATAGDVEHAKAALDSAKNLLSEQGAHPDPAWLDYFDWSRLHGFEGFCLRVKQPEAAQIALRTGLALLEQQAIKERACLLADLAATHLPLEQPDTAWAVAEVEEACRIARQSVALLAETGYATGLQRIDELRAWLTPRHGAVAAVRELVEMLRDLRILKVRSTAWAVDG